VGMRCGEEHKTPCSLVGFSSLKMEAAGSLETIITIYRATPFRIQEGCHHRPTSSSILLCHTYNNSSHDSSVGTGTRLRPGRSGFRILRG